MEKMLGPHRLNLLKFLIFLRTYDLNRFRIRMLEIIKSFAIKKYSNGNFISLWSYIIFLPSNLIKGIIAAYYYSNFSKF